MFNFNYFFKYINLLYEIVLEEVYYRSETINMVNLKHGLNFIFIVILSSFETTNKNVELQKLKRLGMKQRHPL